MNLGQLKQIITECEQLNPVCDDKTKVEINDALLKRSGILHYYWDNTKQTLVLTTDITMGFLKITPEPFE